MKKSTFCLFLPIILLFLISVNCSKDKNSKAKSKTELLTQAEWVVVKFEEKVNNDPYVDDVPNWEPCDKDDRYVFKTGNTYEFNEGPSKCDASDPQIISAGSWALTENETKITINSESYIIEQLDENTFIISYSEIVNTDTYYLKITFGH